MKANLQIVVLNEVSDQPEDVRNFAAESDLMIRLDIDGEMAGLIGFIPFESAAYLWMVKTPVAVAHPVVFARYAKRVIDTYKSKYHTIYGHSNIESWRWLHFLGAGQTPLPGDIVEFTIHGR